MIHEEANGDEEFSLDDAYLANKAQKQHGRSNTALLLIPLALEPDVLLLHPLAADQDLEMEK